LEKYIHIVFVQVIRNTLAYVIVS